MYVSFGWFRSIYRSIAMRQRYIETILLSNASSGIRRGSAAADPMGGACVVGTRALHRRIPDLFARGAWAWLTCALGSEARPLCPGSERDPREEWRSRNGGCYGIAILRLGA